MKKKILISASIMIAGIMFWFVANLLLGAVEMGPNRTYDFSSKYRMVRGTLYYYPETIYSPHAEECIEEHVGSFCVKVPWLFGKTDKGYFAVNMDSHQKYYPLDTVETLTDKTGVQILTEDWLDERKKQEESGYLVRHPEVIKFRKYFNIIFWVAYACAGIGLIIWIAKKPKAKRVQPADCSSDK